LLPLVAFSGFSLLQTISFRNASSAGITNPFWNAISADPFQTRLFVLQLGALTLAGALFYRYVTSRIRISTLIHVIIGVAVASALFGIIRQTTQTEVGFGLPLLRPEQGYGQFINKNHFAFLAEMGFGLALGLLVAGRVSRERALIYFTSLLPIWTALVLSNSRGGLLAMLAQLVIAALLFTAAASSSRGGEAKVAKIFRWWPVRIALIAVLVIGVFIGTLWVGGDRLVSNIEAVSSEFDANAATRYGSSRTEIWKATLRMFREHPIAGIGMGGYWIAISAYHDSSGKRTPHEAHSDYLELLASGGVIGLALGAWFALAVCLRVRRNLKARSHFRRAVTFAATLGIAGVAVHSLVDFGLHMIVNALILVALITIATSNTDFTRENGGNNSYV
ncbi:MAG TPA: O-antigen ligase family protein, partial [Pyrinomonadaceae bacterium]|nr:O-antigen ligase family protein [Pyrinomonadaceae bacterium]